MTPLIITLLGLALAYGAFAQAGVTLEWNWVLCAIGVASAIHFLARKPGRSYKAPSLPWLPAICLFAIPALTALSILPLPVSIIRTLSPSRFDLLAKTSTALGVALPSSTTLSITPVQSLQYLLTVTGLVLVFLVVRDLESDCRTNQWLWAPVWPILIVAALEAGLGFLQAYVVGDINNGGYAHGTYANRDHFAGLLELALPFALLYPFAILQRSGGSQASPAVRAGGLMTVTALIIVATILSLSRMAFLALFASAFVAGALVFGLPWKGTSQTVSVTRNRWIPIGLVAIAVLAGLIYLPTNPLIARFGDLAKTEDINADTRVQLWHDTEALIAQSPIWGTGLGSYESALYRFKTVAPMNTADYAHNDYLQVLAEMGITGFAAGLILVGFVLASALRGAIYAKDSDERYFQIAAISSLVAILIHSFVDFNLYVPANSFVIAWVAGAGSTRLGRAI